MIAPAYHWVPPRVGSYGDEAVDLGRVAGLEIDDEQCLAIDALLSYGPGGRWVALESAILEGRQNGKTMRVLVPVTLFDLFLLPPDRIVWTAQVFRTARDAFDAFCVCIETAPELSKRVKKISYGHGEEFIHLHSGAKLDFLARNKLGGRGLGGKRVVMDEALFIAASSMGALMPVLSARPDPQINYGSSAALESSDHLHRLKKRGRAGCDPSLIWLEWCAPGSWASPPCELGRRCPHAAGSPGCALDDESLWQRANHTVGDRITYDYVRAERRTLPPREFGRERLGWHEEPVALGDLIDMAVWSRWVDEDDSLTGMVSLSLDVAPDRSSAAVGMTGRRPDGLLGWHILEHRPGMHWLLTAAVEIDAAYANVGWCVDPSSPAGSLIPDMVKADLVVHEITGRELAQACTSMLESATDGRGRHQGQSSLDGAWRDACTAPLGDSVRFDRKKSGDITPLMVVTLSDHGFRVHGEVEATPWALYA